MLHVGILPGHERWAEFLHHLRFVVLDEAHVYRGVFGSHVAQVVRRLRRLCAAYGAQPQFVLASATIANPQPFAERLVGLPFAAVDDNGAPRPEQTIVLWNPPFVDVALGVRKSALAESSYVLAESVLAGTADDRLRPHAQGRRARSTATRAGASKTATRWQPAPSCPTEPATRRSSAATSSGGCSTASCGPWWRPARSSSASTWAASTSPSSPAFPAP